MWNIYIQKQISIQYYRPLSPNYVCSKKPFKVLFLVRRNDTFDTFRIQGDPASINCQRNCSYKNGIGEFSIFLASV